MTFNRQRFQKATNFLSKYFGVINQADVVKMIGLDNIEGKNLNNSQTNIQLKTPSILDLELSKLLMDDYTGALPINKLSKKIEALLSNDNFVPENPEEEKIKSRLIEIFKNEEINEMLGISNGQNNIINSSFENPNNEKPNLSVIKSNSVIVNLEKRYTDAATIFLNGIPNLELSRIVPYLEIEFILPRPPLNDENVIQVMSLPKFLYGAQKTTNGSSLYSMMDSLKISATELKSVTDQKNDFYSQVGMDLFTSPQMLVNADTTSENKANDVLNKFAPFLSIKKLELNVVPSTGIMSYKSGNLTLVLHDRSRLNEIAEFLKPDLYGQTELDIEYGWIHPDGANVIESDNVYGNFLNGLRTKEKYTVINSSFSMESSNELTITLRIAMKGAVDFELLSCMDNTDKLTNSLKELEELQKLVEEYKNRIFKNASHDKIKELRGVQILDAAMDARNHLVLTPELKQSLNKFRNSLKQSNNPNADDLLNAIENIFSSTKKGKTNGVAVTTDIRTSLQDLVKEKINRLTNNGDPFFFDQNIIESKKTSTNNRGKINFLTKKGRKSAFKPRFTETIPLGTPVSLAKLLLYFIGEPLAVSKKFADIQLIFHGFNSHAGAMRDKNIGEFPIDLSYFTEQYYRLRESNLNKSANLSLKQFLDFLADIILDDHAAPAYGLIDINGEGNSLFKRKENGQAEAINEVPVFQEKIEKVLLNYGISDGTFIPGKIQFIIETLPERIGVDEGENINKKSARNILKIHVVDQANTSYETLGKLLTAQRDASLSIFNPIQTNKSSSELTPSEQSKNNEAMRLLQAASSINLLEPINDNTREIDKKLLNKPRMYRIKGGQKAVQNFLMQTMPYVMYGAAGSTIKSVNLSSQQIAELSTIHLQRSYQRTDLDPNGSGVGGLPLQIIPTQLSIQCLGNPLISFAQAMYFNFNTSTTADNIYAVVGLTHVIEQGTFETDIKLVPLDAYGHTISLVNKLTEASTLLSKLQEEKNNQ